MTELTFKMNNKKTSTRGPKPGGKPTKKGVTKKIVKKKKVKREDDKFDKEDEECSSGGDSSEGDRIAERPKIDDSDNSDSSTESTESTDTKDIDMLKSQIDDLKKHIYSMGLSQKTFKLTMDNGDMIDCPGCGNHLEITMDKSHKKHNTDEERKAAMNASARRWQARNKERVRKTNRLASQRYRERKKNNS